MAHEAVMMAVESRQPTEVAAVVATMVPRLLTTHHSLLTTHYSLRTMGYDGWPHLHLLLLALGVHLECLKPLDLHDGVQPPLLLLPLLLDDLLLRALRRGRGERGGLGVDASFSVHCRR